MIMEGEKVHCSPCASWRTRSIKWLKSRNLRTSGTDVVILSLSWTPENSGGEWCKSQNPENLMFWCPRPEVCPVPEERKRSNSPFLCLYFLCRLPPLWLVPTHMYSMSSALSPLAQMPVNHLWKHPHRHTQKCWHLKLTITNSNS
jgi:hypothetical protein